MFSFLKQDYVTKRLGNAGIRQLPRETLSKQTASLWRKFRKAVYEVFLLCSVPCSMFLWLGMEQWLWPVTDESMLYFYQTPKNISTFWSKNSWLCWKRHSYFQRPSNDTWDTRKQGKFLDIGLRNRHRPEFNTGDSCPQTKGEGNPVEDWQFIAKISRTAMQSSPYWESVTIRGKRNRNIHRQLEAYNHHHILHGNGKKSHLKCSSCKGTKMATCSWRLLEP